MSQTDLTLRTPEVRTLACPAPGVLVAARGVVERNALIRAAFIRARQEKLGADWLARELAPELTRVLEASPVASMAAAMYLADEFTQLGDLMLVIDPGTGRAIASFTEADLWVPPPVPREGGVMAQPLPRLRPALEGFLISYLFDQARDSQLLARVQASYPGTTALCEDGDPRQRAITRAGRADMVGVLRDRLPTLLEAVQGASRTFLQHFELAARPPMGLTGLPQAVAVATSSQLVVDPLTFNLHHDLLRAQGARIGTQWVRQIAHQLATQGVPSRTVISRQDLLLGPASFWVIPPDAYQTFASLSIQGILAVEGVLPTGLLGQVGIIVVDPSGYQVQAREVFGRWEIHAQMRYTLYFDSNAVFGLDIQDLPVQTFSEII